MRVLLLLLGAFLASTAGTFAQASATLRPGDLFEMRLSGMPAEFANEFALQYTVGNDGTVNIPLIADIRAEGLSSSELQRAIEARFVAEKIFTRPTVIINVMNIARTVTVGGQIRAPSRIQWSNDLTLLSAISAAGGPSEFAGDKVRLIRGGKPVVYSRKQINREPANDPKLLPGDQIDLQ